MIYHENMWEMINNLVRLMRDWSYEWFQYHLYGWMCHKSCKYFLILLLRLRIFVFIFFIAFFVLLFHSILFFYHRSMRSFDFKSNVPVPLHLKTGGSAMSIWKLHRKFFHQYTIIEYTHKIRQNNKSFVLLNWRTIVIQSSVRPSLKHWLA